MTGFLKRLCFIPVALAWLVLYFLGVLYILALCVWWMFTGSSISEPFSDYMELVFGDYWDWYMEWANG